MPNHLTPNHLLLPAEVAFLKKILLSCAIKKQEKFVKQNADTLKHKRNLILHQVRGAYGLTNGPLEWMACIWGKMYSVFGFNMKDLMSTVPCYGIIFWLFATADVQVCLNFNLKALAMQSNSLDG